MHGIPSNYLPIIQLYGRKMKIRNINAYQKQNSETKNRHSKSTEALDLAVPNI